MPRTEPSFPPSPSAIASDTERPRLPIEDRHDAEAPALRRASERHLAAADDGTAGRLARRVETRVEHAVDDDRVRAIRRRLQGRVNDARRRKHLVHRRFHRSRPAF